MSEEDLFSETEFEPEILFLRWALEEYTKVLSTPFAFSILPLIPLLQDFSDLENMKPDDQIVPYILDALDYVSSIEFKESQTNDIYSYIGHTLPLLKEFREKRNKRKIQ
jgi:hypothetical protein